MKKVMEKEKGYFDFPKVCHIDLSQTVEYKIEKTSEAYNLPNWARVVNNKRIYYTAPEVDSSDSIVLFNMSAYLN